LKFFYGDGAGGFSPGPELQAPSGPYGLNAIDLNGDGKLDLIGVDPQYLYAFLNLGDRNWSASIGPPTPFGNPDIGLVLGAGRPSAGDLDGNGVIDQVAGLCSSESTTPNQVLVFEGSVANGDLTWTNRILDSGVCEGADREGVADLNDDGLLDIYVAVNNGFLAYLGDGTGQFTKQTIELGHTVAAQVFSFAVGEINGDGVGPDIVTSRATSSEGAYAGFDLLLRKGIVGDLTARVALSLGPDANDDTFTISHATFILGDSSDGIAPPTEAVTLRIGTVSLTIPPGSFHPTSAGAFAFAGVIDGVTLQVTLTPLTRATFALEASGAGATLRGIAVPVPVGLTIGDDSGSTTLPIAEVSARMPLPQR
jgi:hypothetical protein